MTRLKVGLAVQHRGATAGARLARVAPSRRRMGKNNDLRQRKKNGTDTAESEMINPPKKHPRRGGGKKAKRKVAKTCSHSVLVLAWTPTTKLSPGDITEYAEEGAYIHGLTMEGARWDVAEGTIKDSKPKELRCLLPVINVVPVTNDKLDTTGYYMCPVYMNMQRANVYSAQVSTFTLKHPEDQPSVKWTLASVALLMQDELAA